ncbi:MAG: efflux RND transporter periplasmic adaptor subunit [Pseudomonadota bacterium]
MKLPGAAFALSLILGIATGAHANEEIVPVSVVSAEDILISVDYDAAAAVVPANDSLLSAAVTARVETIHADIGQVVSRGEPLVTLEARDFKLSLAAANANLAQTQADITLAKSRLERRRALAEQQYVSADELADQVARLAALEAQADAQSVAIDQAKAALSDTRIVAPFDGVITERSAQVGSLLQIGSPAIRIVQTTGVEISARAADDAIIALQDIGEARFLYRQQSWPVRPVRISPVIDSRNRVQEVRLTVDGQSQPAAGLPGRLRWTSSPQFLPVPYVQRREGVLGVFIERDGIAIFEPLVEAEEGRPARFTLPRDARIIDRGRQRLQPGVSVKTERP